MTNMTRSTALMAAGLIAVGAIWSGCASSGSAAARDGQRISTTQRAAVDNAVAQVKPALVRIQVVEPSHSGGRESKFVASGSGAIITTDGYVITNHHVAGKAVRIVCTMPNREEIPAVLVGTDPATDIAVIKLMPDEPREFPVARFGNSDELRAGDTVLALGSPLGLSQSVTLGIVSNTEMIIPSLYRGMSFTLDGENVGELVKWIGHDAQIFGGNSGGPLINLDGEIIGVNEISFGLGGAIPGNLAEEVALELIERGTVRRAYVGAIIQPLLKGGSERTGALVASVLRGSPAEAAGLRAGDVVRSINGQEVEVRFLEDLPEMNAILAALPIGEEVAVRVHRNGQPVELTMVPEERQPALQPTTEQRLWGLTARDLTVYTALDLNRETDNGVLVTSTRSGGPVAKATPEIRRGDVITHVNNQTITNVAAFESLTRTLTENAEGFVPTVVTYERNGESVITVVEVGIDDLDNPGADARRGWLPIETQVLTRDLARQLGKEDIRGVRVTRVYQASGENYPLKVGDIITHVDGDQLEAAQAHDAEVFNTLIRQYRIGSDTELRVLRDGEVENVTVDILSSPPRSREMRRMRDFDFEFVVREATFWDRENPRLRGVDVNVMVDSVTDGGWASLGDLRNGDVILSIGGRHVDDIEMMKSLMDRVHEERPRTVEFKVRRGVNTVFLEMEPLWDNSELLGTSITASRL